MGQATIQGKATDTNNGEPIIFANVVLYRNGNNIGGTETDLDGNYIFGGLDAGTYDVEISYVGYATQRIADIVVQASKVVKVDISMNQGETLQTVEIVGYKVPLIEFDNTTTGNTVTSEQIKSLPVKDLNAIAATSAGLSSVDGGAISMRGARSGGTVYFIDGIRTFGSIPQTDVEQLQVITGGVEAKYGDVSGGIISLTSKGPSNSYTGYFEAETSEGLDAQGYNLLSANLSGPIWKKGDKSIIGFRFSGQYIGQADNRPSYDGVYRLPESTIRELEENPTINFGANGDGTAAALENVGFNEIGPLLSMRPNEDRRAIDVTAKIDAQLTDNIDISISGAYNDTQDRFTVGGDGGTNIWALANWTNNPYQYNDRLRTNFRFRHKIGNQGIREGLSDEEKANQPTIQNFSYTLQLGFERGRQRNEDLRHEDNLFRYGYYGRVDRAWTPELSPRSDIDNFGGEVYFNEFNIPVGHQGYAENVGEFTINEQINPVLARYNEENGFREVIGRNAFSDLFQNVGQIYNVNRKSESDIYTLNVASGFDLVPNGSEKGRHNIQFGFLYEQRVNRSWSMNPRGLWTLARIRANNHIVSGVDFSDQVGSFTPSGEVFDRDGNPVTSVAQYNTLVSDPGSIGFIQNVRALAGQALNEYVNIDGLNPDDMTLSMFSAQELNNANFNLLGFNYYGYDYLGNKLPTSTTFDDFFTQTDQNGDRVFNVAPWTPVWAGGYIQDKFTYKDIIFRLGVRLDYYDANSKVLRDPYSLYDIETAADFHSRTGTQQPVSVADDYKVYVAGAESEEVIGYRQGDNWFLPNGTSVSNGAVIFQGGLVNPSYTSRAAGITQPDVRAEGFNLDYSFEDYEPQININPRLAFSFPISDDAGFFAHYDILTQRPTNTIATALDYFYFNDRVRTNNNGSPINDPRLRPVQTVDYQVGFQQKLSNTTALKISAYYRELRDLIQRRFYTNVPAPLNNYEAFGNLDFSTVKGFSFQLDRRRTGNLQLTATYTLQFADGSGSDANSSGGLNIRGPIRTLLPLDVDERHRITSTIDYRYSGGKNYNGPVLFGKDILANTGANFVLTAVSGRPYTDRIRAEEFNASGFQVAINDARLPWTINIDMRVDKDFTIVTNQTTNKAINLNIYLRAQNLLNTRNVIGVYEFTGDPENDGFLVTPFGEDRIRQIANDGRNVGNFLDQYNAALLEPGFFAMPRRMYIGAIVQF